jgi:energy-coupling factor transporter ATP-binding protein EcfA2
MPEIQNFNEAGHIRAVGRIEEVRRRIQTLMSRLELAPRWQLSYVLKAQCSEALRLLDDLAHRSERKLTVALIGPSGAGKSTILNALARHDGLSATGHSRPTTRNVVVYCKNADDAQPLVEKLGVERVTTVSSPAAAELDQVILIDTPDTDSQMCPEHRAIIERVVGQIDVLLCVFNSENPKGADNIDFLVPIVDKFPGEFLYAVLSHCDRRPENELREDVLPDFQRHLSKAWIQKPQQVFCVSGRRHLKAPGWDAGATPLHDYDEFDQLRELVFGSINRGSVVVDARIKRAERIWAVLARETADRTGNCLAALETASARTRDLSNRAIQAAARKLDTFQSQATLGVQLLLYRQLSQRW